MRFLLVLALLAFAAPDASKLNELLDERADINLKYKKDNIKTASEMEYAKQLIGYETEVADVWAELIEFAKQSDDNELKQIVLRLEYAEELRGYGYDLEFAENEEAEAVAKAAIEKYTKLQEIVK